MRMRAVAGQKGELAGRKGKEPRRSMAAVGAVNRPGWVGKKK
jgi:hypothetical protein